MEGVFEQMSSPIKLDVWVNEGVKLHQDVLSVNSSGSPHHHVSVDDVFGCRSFQEMCPNLKLGLPFQGTVAKRQNLIDAFQSAIDFGVESSRLAIVLTKSGETVLCIADCTYPEYRWFLFDSHGQSHEKKKLAYCKEYGSFHRLLDGFLAKYPVQNFGGDTSIQSSMYNLFEAVPIVLDSYPRPSAPLSTLDSADPKDTTSAEAGFETVEVSHCQTTEKPKLSTNTLPAGILDKSRFQCAISLEIMADPVVASDGHHYDRPEIEKHFEARRAAEMERIAAEEARANGEASEADIDTSCCCGATPEITLTSPKTGLKIDGTLTPILFLEEMIVELVESNALNMTDEEVSDWQQRRAEKKRRDKERQAQQRIAEAEEEEQRRFEAQAEERYGNRPVPPPVELSHQFHVIRDINDECEVPGENDLGIAVALGDKRYRIPPVYAKEDNRSPRCMVACCAVPLSSNTWCERCQRLVCDDCLGFSVSKIQPQLEDQSVLHRVCFECVTQIVDVMESQDTLTRQRRALILRGLEKHLALLTNRLSTKQDSVIRHEMNDEFSHRVEEVQGSISLLLSQLNHLRAQVRREEERANAAAADDGSGQTLSTNEALRGITEQLSSVEQQWNELLQEEEPIDDDELMQHVCRRSELWQELQRLSDAQNALVVAQSTGASKMQIRASSSVDDDLAALDRLQRRLALHCGRGTDVGGANRESNRAD